MLKGLIGKDWSVAVFGLESNPLRLPASATPAPEPLCDADQKHGPVVFLQEYSMHLARGYPASHPLVSQIIKYALRNPRFKASREHSCLTQPLSKHRLHANEAVLLMHESRACYQSGQGEGGRLILAGQRWRCFPVTEPSVFQPVSQVLR